MRFFPRFLLLIVWSAIWLGSAARPAAAHPMGNFSINHYARFEAVSGGLRLKTILDFAEIPTSERMAQVDANGDGKISEAEKTAFLKSEVAASQRGLSVRVDGRKAALQAQSSQLDIRPGAAGLQTLRVVMNWKIHYDRGASSPSSSQRVEYADSNFPDRNGWMEVIAVGVFPQKIKDSNAATVDRSRELIVFPVSGDTAPPRQREAAFSVASGAKTDANTGQKMAASVGSNPNSTKNEGDAAPATNSQTPQNRFTQSIAVKQLTPGLFLGGLLAALAFGAVHALSPGHGKTMVAAYLVGSRGTPRHAILLGLVVTVTHTLGVFALGWALLFASRYVLPERLFPMLSAASGLLIFGVGLWLLMSRWQLLTGDNHAHLHGDHTHDGSTAHDHSHEHDPSREHSHGGRAHSHAIPEGPITLRTLVALGISGGIVPCPEALVVLLAAVKLHRISYGMFLITAFSVGLAGALIAIGLIVVAARERFGASARFGSGSALARYLPLGSAAAITVIGIVLTLRAVGIGGL
ncbi:ABC-type nickel/cobalt efflux system, permease component RcnA [Abditibacterium utsteinense]|uniref:ABC-type nickel/cobalt efflux system, permease component RcnA n=1 Tax=Abditibacterium utsteinense TaxID=1960156 RepID=A0A2S8SRG3_9BACT|nr:hypothetical protein [Abditibacterium utsteinense]PQV63339.1 ABC-type nickel/cobalt efflux system, permease component RcnA [Abditibacterium utsteinense]